MPERGEDVVALKLASDCARELSNDVALKSIACCKSIHGRADRKKAAESARCDRICS